MAFAIRLPRLLEIKLSQDGLPYCIHDDGGVAIHFSLSHLDAELTDPDALEHDLTQVFKDLALGVKIRLRSSTQYSGGFDFPHARSTAISETGAIENELVLTFEAKRLSALNFIAQLFKRSKNNGESIDDELFNRLKEKVETRALERLGLTLTPIIDEEKIRSLYFNEERPLVLTPSGLDLGTEVIAVLKLQRLGTNPLTFLDLALIRESLPLPFEIHFAAEKISSFEAQLLLSRRSKQESTGQGAVAATKYQETQVALEEIELRGTELFKFELSVMLRRLSDGELRLAVSQALLELKRLGEFRQETKGALSAFIATIPGSDFHFTLLERDEAIACYAPISARSDMEVPSRSPGAMAYHREDSSLSMLDLFNERYTSFSSVIIGQPGLGKSVLANTLLRSIMSDEHSRVILVDVKGSHVRTTTRLNGSVNNVSLDKPSGINPLGSLRSGLSRDELQIVTSFIKQLMLNEGEVDLPVKESFQLDELVQSYAESSPQRPSIDDLIKYAGDRLYRREHLARWGSQALYGNIFAERKSSKTEKPRLTYFNFEQIMTASDKAVATGVLAAVMAEFSFELLRKSSKEKLYFIADETPFFVVHAFQSFRLLMKNVRKLNGSLVLIAQDHSDLVVHGDPSLLNNAAIKILFSLDGDRNQYRERLRITEADMEALKTLRGSKGEFSKFLLKDELGSRIGTLKLSREEYLFSSTSAQDRARVDAIRQALPDLSEIEALHLIHELSKLNEAKNAGAHL